MLRFTVHQVINHEMKEKLIKYISPLCPSKHKTGVAADDEMKMWYLEYV